MTVYIIAEAGVNHNGSLESAKTMVEVAAEAGCDAIKFQTYRADALTHDDASVTEYQQNNTGETSQRELLKQYQLKQDEFRELHAFCGKYEIDFLSSPFDRRSLSFLVEELGIERIKIPSGEITNGPLLYDIGAHRRPVLLSTGMSTMGEIKEALGVLAFGACNESMKTFNRDVMNQPHREYLREYLTVLQCTSAYPTPEDEVNLRCLTTLEENFDVDVGFSDHTIDVLTPALAVARGAGVVEKHFTLDRDQTGPDHSASLEPPELERMVHRIRQTETMLGTDVKKPTPTENQNRESVRKSLYAAETISSGDNFTQDNLAAKRPAGGMSPMRYWDLLGEPASRTYEEGEAINE